MERPMKKIAINVSDIQQKYEDGPPVKTQLSEEELQYLRKERHAAYLRYQRNTLLMDSLLERQPVKEQDISIFPTKEELLKKIDDSRADVLKSQGRNEELEREIAAREQRYRELVENLKRCKTESELNACQEEAEKWMKPKREYEFPKKTEEISITKL